MTLGQVVDFCIEYNRINSPAEEDNSATIRQATQEDWDRLGG